MAKTLVLVSFATLFVVFALVLSLLLWYSQRHDGVVAARQSFVYIWRFGPIAVITIIAAFWARVELQAMRYMPWIALHSSGLTLNKTKATLDYTSMLLPKVFIQSIKQKHHLLSLVIVTSIILTAQIALAPGLFSLATVRAEYDVSIQTLDSFDTEKYANASEIPQETSAFYNVRAIRDFDMAYPFGVNDELAYQTFRSRGDKSDGSRGTVREPLKAVVDGLFAEVQCLELKNYSANIKREEKSQPGIYRYTFDVELYFEGCDKAISVEYEWNPPPRPRKSGQWMIDNELSPERSCSSLPQKNKQFAYYAAQLGPLVKNSSSPPWPVIGKAAAVICTSAAWLSKVEVSDDGISPNVTLISNEEKTPIAANPWDLLANIENRLDINVSSKTGPPPIEGLPAVEATIFGEGDYRLVQDATATYVLIGILSSVVLFNLWGLLSAALRWWGFSKGRALSMDVKGLAPDGFNSFAALASLLRDSNALSHLPEGTELLSTDELHGMFPHLGFHLGWFQDETDESKHFTIGVLEDEDFKFLARKK
ncbi:hypothetical protein CGCF415_v007490 [Colletotrichum fructicola]|nr:hypothetical protein CGCF415_v007490 [Colletotrichum fructicola]KAF4936733.1 hypothetical protein CGCF245_v006284 [Colletotrichum fructicola]